MSSLEKEIEKLKREKNALILAHYYAPAEVQALADDVGDSYYLAQKAVCTDAKVIVFCGVGFMGESVKILNENKTVLMPDMNADCPMAHMAQVEKIQKMRQDYEDLAVVCYINSGAALKCVSDVCVTSSNAVKIVRSLPQHNIYFIPDRHLGQYVAEMVPEKNIILNDGYCPIHASLLAEEVVNVKKKHPEAKVLAHPECNDGVLALADYVGSTQHILEYAHKSEHDAFIVCTEVGIDHALTKQNPGKRFYYPEKPMCCIDMKYNTAEKVLRVLQTGENEVKVAEEVKDGALAALRKMLEVAK